MSHIIQFTRYRRSHRCELFKFSTQPRICQDLFSRFSKFLFVCCCAPGLCRSSHNFLSLPQTTPFVNTLFRIFRSFLWYAVRDCSQPAYISTPKRFCQVVFYKFCILFLVDIHKTLLDMVARASTASKLVSSRFARSDKLTMPHRRPFSTTGRRRT